jgi:hypothetical protein
MAKDNRTEDRPAGAAIRPWPEGMAVAAIDGSCT